MFLNFVSLIYDVVNRYDTALKIWGRYLRVVKCDVELVLMLFGNLVGEFELRIQEFETEINLRYAASRIYRVV